MRYILVVALLNILERDLARDASAKDPEVLNVAASVTSTQQQIL